MPLGTAAALLLGGVASAGIGANAAGKAADAQVDGANRSAQLALQGTREQIAAQDRARAEIMEATAPQRLAGQNALVTMQQMAATPFTPTDYTKSAAHEFQLAEGEQSLERMMAARGIGRSGAAMKGALRFSQGLGSQFETDHYNREMNANNARFNKLAGIANIGSGAQAQNVNSIQSSANTTGNAIMQGNALAGNAFQQAGNARASGYQNAGKAWQGLIGDGAGTLGMYQGGYFDNQKPLSGLFS